MPVINPDHLLEQADRLVAPPAVGAPRQADLRRAISTAYYALFHALLTAAADDFVGQNHRQSTRYELAYRSIGHIAAHSMRGCQQANTARYTKYEPVGGFGADLGAAAKAFVELQEKRHSADYDPLFRVGTSDAVLAVATSRAALARFRNAPRPRRKAFLSLIVFSPR
jgi:hypothetical protein